jgi:type IV secretory pathway VirJ component
MRKIFAFALLFSVNLLNASPADTLIFGAFGKVVIYKPGNVPDAVVLFVSGDGGWNLGVIDMAENIRAQGALVAGIDIQHYYKALKKENVKCYYPAGDFEELSLAIQKRYKIKEYMKPILVGYSSGATLVYGILAQAPANTFKGAISLGFCADIETDKTLCNGTGLTSHVIKQGNSYYLEKCDKLTAPWLVLQGKIDQVCFYADIEKYVEGISMAELISLPNVGHGFSVTKNWLPQFITAYGKIQSTPSFTDQLAKDNTLLKSQHLEPLPANLPLTLIPTSSEGALPMAFVISGDGGWTSFDESISEALSAKGMPVAGLDSQKYFWSARTPEETAAAIAPAIEYYMRHWNKKSFVLVGYSFGACIAPFVTTSFSDSLKGMLHGVYMLSPDEKADFEIHISDMLSLGSSKDKYDVIEEVKKIKSLHPVCLFGTEEDAALRNRFSDAGAAIITLPGTHHYNNNYSAVAESILESILSEK